jgi:hypothetical protein
LLEADPSTIDDASGWAWTHEGPMSVAVDPPDLAIV